MSCATPLFPPALPRRLLQAQRQRPVRSLHPRRVPGRRSPQWRPDGAELFYIAPDGKLMATSIKPAADHQSVDIGAPVPLFAAQIGGAARPVLGADYVSSVDGQRFLVNRL